MMIAGGLLLFLAAILVIPNLVINYKKVHGLAEITWDGWSGLVLTYCAASASVLVLLPSIFFAITILLNDERTDQTVIFFTVTVITGGVLGFVTQRGICLLERRSQNKNLSYSSYSGKPLSRIVVISRSRRDRAQVAWVPRGAFIALIGIALSCFRS